MALLCLIDFHPFLSGYKGTKTNGHFEIYTDCLNGKFGWNTYDMCIAQLSNKVIDDNTYHHLVVLQKNNLLTFFVDNVQQGQYTCNGSIQNKITHFTIGKLIDNGIDCYTKGLIDDIRIYNRALTESEIQQLFNE